MNSKLPDIKLALRGKGIAFKDADFTARHTDVNRSLPSETNLAIMPSSGDELKAVIVTLNKFEQPFVIVSGNTGYAGAQRASENEVHLDLCKLNQIKSIRFTNGDELKFSEQMRGENLDPFNVEKWAAELKSFLDNKKFGYEELKQYTKGAILNTEAGVSVGAINEVLKPAMQFIPFDAGSAKTGGASIGGVVSNYSFGADARALGSPADCCISLSSVNGNGMVRNDKGAGGKLREFNPNEALLRSDRLPLGNNAIGGQGTFAVAYEMELVTREIPEQRHIFLIKFDNYEQVSEFRKLAEEKFDGHIRQFELMNGNAVRNVKDHNPSRYHNYFEKADIANYYVMLDLMDTKKLDIANNVGMDAYVLLSEHIKPENMAGFGDFTKQGLDSSPVSPVELVHELRHSMSEASDNLARQYAIKSGAKNYKGNPDLLAHRVTIDMCVPQENYGEMLEYGKQIAEEFGMKLIVFGHAAAYGGHMHFISEERLDVAVDKDGTTKKQLFQDKMQAKMKELGGPCSSEHAIGQLYAREWNEFASEEDKLNWLAVKLNEDTKNIVNPNSNHFAAFIKQIASPDAAELRANLKKIAIEKYLNNTLSFLEGLEQRSSSVHTQGK